MTFPQPSSVAPVLGGQQTFRLLTPIASAGDIYESEVGALAFALGPQSDIATVQLNYYDAQQPGYVNSAIISPDRQFVGRVDARNETTYVGPGQRKGRILISSKDVWDPTLLPSDYDAAGGGSDTIEFITPVIDVMQYFVNPPSLIPPRSDKLQRFEYFPGAPDTTDGVSWVALPAYGRKSGYFTFFNRHPTDTIRVTVYGWRLATAGNNEDFTKSLFTDDLLFADSATYNYKASTDGLWDLLLIALGGPALAYDPAFAFPTSVILSDDPQ